MWPFITFLISIVLFLTGVGITGFLPVPQRCTWPPHNLCTFFSGPERLLTPDILPSSLPHFLQGTIHIFPSWEFFPHHHYLQSPQCCSTALYLSLFLIALITTDIKLYNYLCVYSCMTPPLYCKPLKGCLSC